MLEELGGDSSSSTSKETAIKGFGANIYSGLFSSTMLLASR